MFLASCQHPDLASTNVANLPGGTALDLPAQYAPTSVKITGPHLQGIRDGLSSLFGPTGNFGKLTVNACPVLNGCSCQPLDVSASAPLHCFRPNYQDAPNLVDPPGPATGYTTLPLFPPALVLPPSASFGIAIADATELEVFNPQQYSPYTLRFNLRSNDVWMAAGGKVIDPVTGVAGEETAGSSAVSLAFPMTVEFPDDHVSDLHCNCFTGGGSPTGAAGAVCAELCSGIEEESPDVALVTCYDIKIRVRLNRVKFRVGIMPVALDAASMPKNPHWTRDFFGGAKDFHLDKMFGLRAVAIAGGTLGTGTAKLPGDSTNTNVDVGVGVDAYCPTSWLGSTVDACGDDCETKIATSLAQKIAERLTDKFSLAVAGVVSKNVLRFDPPQFPPPLPSVIKSLPCDPNAAPPAGKACAEYVGKNLIPASIAYQLWDWFAGPFGPYGHDQKGYLPVTQITSLSANPPGGQEFFTPMIRIFFDNDMDGDGVVTPLDNCPAASNADQKDSDADGVGDVCDGCRCSANEVDPNVANVSSLPFLDGDGVCNCDWSLPGCFSWCQQHPADNCPNAPNPTQANCNEDAELAAGAVLPQDSGTNVLGDVCDSVPCADAATQPEPLGVTFAASPECKPKSYLQLGTKPCPILVDTRLRWRGIVSGPDEGKKGATEFAHCPCDKPHATVDERKGCWTFLGGKTRCVMGDAKAFPGKAGPAAPSAWQAITTRTFSTNLTLPKYEQNVQYSSAYARTASPVIETVWNFESDLGQFGITPPGSISKAFELELTAQGLDGVGWAATRSLDGGTLTGPSVFSGKTIADLAGHYFVQDLDPRPSASSYVIKQTKGLMITDFIFCPECPGEGPVPWIKGGDPEILAISPVLPSGGPKQNPTFSITEALSPATAAVLSQLGVSREIVFASEPSAVLRAQGIAVRGVLLDATSLLPIADVLEMTSGLAFSSREVCPPGVAACDVLGHRSVRAVSALRSELYVVGRDGPGHDERLVVLDLVGTGISDLALTGVDATGSERSLAYRMNDDSLYLVDIIGSGSSADIRLLRVRRTGHAVELLRAGAPGKPENVDAFVAISDDGLVLLAVSGPSDHGRPLYLLLDPDKGAGQFAIVGWMSDPEPGRVLLAPEARRNGTFSVVKRGKDGGIVIHDIPWALLQTTPKPMSALEGLLH